MTSGISRRDFLKGSAATAVTLSAGLSAASRARAATPPSDIVRVGFIGTGSQGLLLMAQMMKMDDVDIVAVCDLYPPHLERANILAEDSEPYEDYRKLLERKDIDAVIIATPLHEHARITVDALDAGKDVFCEKMMAYSIEESRGMVRKARDTGKILQIGHQRRVNSTYQHAYHLLNEKKICGKLTFVRAQWHRNGSWRRAIPDPQFEKLLNWRMYRETSQGLMAELGSHQIDGVNWFLNSLPKAVMASGGIDYWQDGRTTMDNISVIYEYPEGIRCVYTSITSNEHHGFTEEYMGDEGTLIVSPEKGLLFREPKAEQLVWAPLAHKDESNKDAILLDAGATRSYGEKGEGEELKADSSDPNKDYYVELDQFVDSIRTRKEPLANPKVCHETCVASLMANHAANTGRRIELRPEIYKV